jgi:hypothetical protein
MKLLSLIIGLFFTYFGYQEVSAATPDKAGWLVMAIGISVIMISIFGTKRNSDESDSFEISDAGDSSD